MALQSRYSTVLPLEKTSYKKQLQWIWTTVGTLSLHKVHTLYKFNDFLYWTVLLLSESYWNKSVCVNILYTSCELTVEKLGSFETPERLECLYEEISLVGINPFHIDSICKRYSTLWVIASTDNLLKSISGKTDCIKLVKPWKVCCFKT